VELLRRRALEGSMKRLRSSFLSGKNTSLKQHAGWRTMLVARSLIAKNWWFRKRYNVDVRVKSEVVAIDRRAKTVEVVERESGKRYQQRYDKLLLSPGACATIPSIPGIDNPMVFCLRTIRDADKLKFFIQENRPRVGLVVGGGYLGLEMVENLSRAGLQVNVVEMTAQLMPVLDKEMTEFIRQHLELRGVRVLLQDKVVHFESLPDSTVRAALAGGDTIACDLVVVAVGVRPEATLAQEAGLEIGGLGGILVNEYLETSDPDIYAVGDAIEVVDCVTGVPTLIPLAGPANKQGRVAADNMCERRSVYRCSQGTAVVRVFDMTVACTGANEKTLKRCGIRYVKSYTQHLSHGEYFPGATPMVIKLLFSPGDGKILGAQIVGVDGVDKRVDVIAAAIRAGVTAPFLGELELAYAPQYGSAKDPVNIAGYVAENILKGDVEVAQVEEIESLVSLGALLLDVRARNEFERGAIEGAINIPVDELRDRIRELPAGRTIVAYCLSGQRSYLACRILKHHGFKALNLSGSYTMYCVHHPGRTRKIPGIETWRKSTSGSDKAR